MLASPLFRRCVWHHPMAKPDLPPSLQMRHRVLLYMVWSVITYGGRIIVEGHFPPLFSPLLGKVHDCFFFFFNFSLYSFNFLFCSYLFYRSFCFQFSPSTTISYMFCFFYFGLYSFDFGFFCFQFHSSIKIFVALILLIFFLFC
jgi:hypothetical protein